ncbi:hypothetical protein [Porphyromonas vaginalis]|uniref:hypothetical protein n=1 Tax=Porphyromonas vaginalis TaxID=3044325 RepID=UPI002605F92B|nr:hypothetical protein [Porphyromonas vaginalis]
MNPKIYKPEERVSQEVMDKLREDEEYFEQIFPNGAEGFIGDIAIIAHPDYEYGYSYLMDRYGNKLLLDFGDFKYDQTWHKKIFLTGKTHPDGKDCFNGPYFKRLSFQGNPTEKVLYYGFWDDSGSGYAIDNDMVKNVHPFDRIYIGGIIDYTCHFLGVADYEGFEEFITHDLILTHKFNPQSEYNNIWYGDWVDDDCLPCHEWEKDPWIEADSKGIYSVKQRRQIIANNVDRIEVKGSEIFFYAHKDAQPQKYFARHPKDKVNFFNEGYDRMPYTIEAWRPPLIKSPDYFEEEHGIISTGFYAGNDICTLMSDNRQLLLKLCRRNFFHLASEVIEQWEEEYEDIVAKSFFDKLWIANDAHHIYRDITSVDGQLNIWGSSVHVLYKSPDWWPEYVELLGIHKHPETTIKELFKQDFSYIEGLIRLKRVRVSSDVLIALKDVPKSSYTNRLDTLIQYVEEWENEIKEWENEERERQYSEYLAWQEEEERRYYENEGYRDAFDGNPDAYWNID